MDIAMPAASEHETDLSLVEALRRGNSAVMTEFIRRNERWVRGVVYGAVGDVDEVDDVLQRVWLSVWQRSGVLKDLGKWRNWLYTLARNAAVDAARRRGRRRGLWRRLARSLPPPTGRTDSSDCVRRLIVREEHRRVLDAISTMPAIYREPLVLRHVEGWSYRRIAEVLDLPMDTVETRLVRARRLLRKRLKGSEREL